MPVIKPKKQAKTKPARKSGGLDLETKLAKMAIADMWLKDTDNTRYYINVANRDGRNWVRVRIDIPDSEPLTLLLEPGFAVKLATAIFRAAFNAQVMRPEEVAELWNRLKGQFKKSGRDTGREGGANTDSAGSGGSGTGDADIPDFGFQ